LFDGVTEVRYAQKMKLLVDRGADVNARDENGEKVLSHAYRRVPDRHPEEIWY
jgi:hypothetical protein